MNLSDDYINDHDLSHISLPCLGESIGVEDGGSKGGENKGFVLPGVKFAFSQIPLSLMF